MNRRTLLKLGTDNMLLVKKLQSWKVIPEEGKYLCSKCGGQLIIATNNRNTLGYMWICKNEIFLKRGKKKICGKQVALPTRTFFANSKLGICEILIFVYMWLCNLPTRYILHEMKITDKASVAWSTYFREIVHHSFVEKQEPLGGEGITVDIHESKFGLKKFGERSEIEGRWAFGGYEHGTDHVFLETVVLHDLDTLISLIKKWIRPGSTVITSCWKAYNCLPTLGYTHFQVCRDLITGTQKRSLGKSDIPGNLAKYIFTKKCRQEKTDPLEEFLKLAGKLYNPMNEPNDSLPILGFPKTGEYDLEGTSEDESE